MIADPVAFALLLAAVSAVAGAVASVSGFGIGSLLTPLLGVRVGTKLAVAAVSIPHIAATAWRFWMMRRDVDRKLLWNFGLMSAAGGLAGALLHSHADSAILTWVFGGLLIFTGMSELTGLSRRLRFRGWMAWLAGSVSGLLGGLVGNQGGIRAAAMLGFKNVSRHAFVATATAVGLIVDGARLPVYLFTEGRQIADIWHFVAIATAGAIIGTIAGGKLLKRIPEPVYRPIVGVLVLTLGIVMVFRSLQST